MAEYKEFDLMTQELPPVSDQELMDQLLSSLNSLEVREVKVEESEVVVQEEDLSSLEEKIKSRVICKIIPNHIPDHIAEKVGEVLLKRVMKSIVELQKACPDLDEDSMIGLMLASLLTKQI